MTAPKYIEYDGFRFCRDEKTGYYLNSTIRKRLHRYVWEKEIGAIPKGYHVHHINGDKSDNRIENLSIMTASGHERLHGQEIARKERLRENIKKAAPFAAQWHGSQAGRKWHSDHATGRKAQREGKTCQYCGKLFQGTKTQKYCSNACKSAARRAAGTDLEKRTCEQCGAQFMAVKYKSQKYCSSECKAKAHVGWYAKKHNL